jgi:uncharacterized membrane protein
MRRTLNYNIVLLVITALLVNNIMFSQDATITGKVKYGNEALQGTTVILGDKSTLTDHNGKFSFSIRPGSYTILITHAGYKKIELTIIAEAGSTKNLEFEMMPGELLEAVTLHSGSPTTPAARPPAARP